MERACNLECKDRKNNRIKTKKYSYKCYAHYIYHSRKRGYIDKTHPKMYTKLDSL